MDRKAYSVAEVAQMFGKSQSTIWKWLKDGVLSRHRLGGSTLIPAEEVDALGKENSQEATLRNPENMSHYSDLGSANKNN